jgi:hypothetical protein
MTKAFYDSAVKSDIFGKVDFGKEEIGANTKERTFHWITFSRFKKHIMLNYRLFIIKELIINYLSNL